MTRPRPVRRSSSIVAVKSIRRAFEQPPCPPLWILLLHYGVQWHEPCSIPPRGAMRREASSAGGSYAAVRSDLQIRAVELHRCRGHLATVRLSSHHQVGTPDAPTPRSPRQGT